MIKIPIFNSIGEKSSEFQLNGDYKLNKALIAQVVRVLESRIAVKAGQAKTRGDVRGGGRKPYRQKGTGRARAGSIRSPLFRGGGITFGPNGANQILKIPKKMKQAAFWQLLAYQTEAGDVIGIDQSALSQKKTKDADSVLTKLKLDKKAVLVTTPEEKKETPTWQNLAYIELKSLNNLTVYDLIKNSKFIFSLNSLESLKKRHRQ